VRLERVHDLAAASPHVFMTSRPSGLPTISLANLKGGAAKTVSSVALAGVMVRSGASVLLVDLDPQGTASAWLAERSDAATRLLSGDFDPSEDVTGAFVPEEGSRLDMVTSNRSLEDATERRPSDLSRRLEKLWRGAAEGYDVGMVDTPPQAGSLVTAALLSTASVLVPVAAGRGAVDGLQHVLQYTRRIGGAGVEAAFTCNVDARTYLDRRVAERLIDQLGALSNGGRACRHYVRSTVSVREAEADGSPLGEYAPRSTAWTDYNALAGELFDAGVIPAGPDGAGTEGAASIDEGATT
jgi:chromosome partitioning protein